MKLLLIITALFIYTSSLAQNISFTDANFKNALLNSNCVDTNLDGFGEFDADTNDDGEIQVSEAEAIEGLILFNENIQNLDEISYFTNLKLLLCNTNQITSLDLSNNTQLFHLNCGGNQLSTLDLHLQTDLEELKCHANNLTSLDVSNNPSLNYLNCSSNNLSVLDLSENSNLGFLVCSVNPLLTSIDVSSNTALVGLYCTENNMTQLDVSQNPALTQLRCEDNQLVFLNIANTNNANMYRMFCFNNPDLTCIKVDDPSVNAPACYYEDLFEGWCKDDTATYSDSCTAGVSEIHNMRFQLSPNPAEGFVNIITQENITAIQLYTADGKLIKKQAQSNRMDISDLSPGTYVIKLQINDKIYSEKFIKK